MQALGIAFLGLAIDLLVQNWCYHRNAAFGISEKIADYAQLTSAV